MSEAGASDSPLPTPLQNGDANALIDALRGRGAERFDPIGLRFIVALARRTATHRDEARQMLDRKLAKALAEYGDRLDRAVVAARKVRDDGTARFPETADALRQHFDTGDFRELHRLLAERETRSGGGPLAELLAHIARHTPQNPAGAATPANELKSAKYFRDTFSRLSVDRQLSRALADAPENAGPLNSHFLAVRALTRMHEISPHYTELFILHVDALLWLEQMDSGRTSAHKKTARGGSVGKRKMKRGKAG